MLVEVSKLNIQGGNDMSTRSIIAIRQKDGSIKCNYCHWDGGPEYNGVILWKHYQDRKKVKELIALGSLSYLAPNVAPEPGVEHSFDKPAKGVCVAYCRDRGEDWETNKPRVLANDDEFLKYAQDSWAEYIYIYELDDRWQTIFLNGDDDILLENIPADLEIVLRFKNLI